MRLQRRNRLPTEHRRLRAKMRRNKHRQQRLNLLLVQRRPRQKSRIRHPRKRSQNLPRIKKRTKNRRTSNDTLPVSLERRLREIEASFFSERFIGRAQQASGGRNFAS
jgi:hypothetical protein